MATKQNNIKSKSDSNRSKKHRNPMGTIFEKEIVRNGSTVAVFIARKRYWDADRYRDLTKRCATIEEAVRILQQWAAKFPPREYSHGHTSKKHGGKSLTYVSFEKAKERCLNPNATGYKWYGGRGIKFRFSSFQEFLEEVGERPGKDFSIDRIDPNGHYEKGNVRWATTKIQAKNKT